MHWQGAHLEINPQAAHDTASAQALAAQQPTTATSVDMLTIMDAEFSPEVWQALQARALAQANGGGRQGLAGSAALSLPTTPAALTTDTPEASPALTGLGLTGPAGAARTLATRAGVPSTPMPTGDVDSAYETLNQKFTTELAGRIQQQINSGEWKMKFALKPASLGHLDVQLEMRDGKLSAVFHTDNAMTQDLLSNGSQRLKEALAQMGHHNAAVWVGSDGAGQSPGQRSPNPGTPAQPQSLNPSASDARTSTTDTAGPSTHRSTQDSHLDLFA
jgi:flagellar hook-length control protein FliK